MRAPPVCQTHHESKQAKRHGQSQGPQASRSLKGRAGPTANGKADNHRQGLRRTGARLGDLGMIAAGQHLSKIQHEVSDIRRHDGGGRRVRQRNLDQRVLHRHRRNAKHTRDDREYGVGIAPWGCRNANREEGDKKKQLQQQQRLQGRNPGSLESTGEQTRQK